MNTAVAQTVSLTVNHRAIQAEKGASLLSACLDAGFFIWGWIGFHAAGICKKDPL